MHDTALQLGELFFNVHGKEAKTVLDIGSFDVNGSLRSVCPSSLAYTGADTDAGPGVDIVLTPNQPLPFTSGAFDLVTCSSMLEHDEHFWETLPEMMRVLRPSGKLYINTPSNGIYHAYPIDAWRFYPDSGLCLASWATKCGYPTELIESFIARRGISGWNDTVIVLQRTPVLGLPERFICDLFTCYNVRRYGTVELLKPQIPTEDQQYLSHLAQNSAELLNRWRAGENSAELGAATERFLNTFGCTTPFEPT